MINSSAFFEESLFYRGIQKKVPLTEKVALFYISRIKIQWLSKCLGLLK